MGFTPTNAIGKPQPLIAYMGDYRLASNPNNHTNDVNKALKADIIIPKAQVGGSSNDIGFIRGTDGKFKAIISDFDSRRYNQTWLNRVKVGYADARVMQQANKLGLRLTGRKLNEKTQKMEYAFLKA